MRLYYLAKYEYCKKENCAELTDRLTLLKAETHLSGAAGVPTKRATYQIVLPITYLHCF